MLCLACMSLFISCMPGTCGDQKRVSDPQEQVSQAAVSRCVVAGT